MCLIFTPYILFINAYYISSFTSLYINLITIDVVLLNINRCLFFFSGGQMPGGQMSRGAYVRGGGANVGGKCRGKGQMSGGDKCRDTHKSLSVAPF